MFMDIIIYISLAFLLFFCLMAVMSHSMLRSAIYLALASATLSVILYMLGAVWAAVIEVSACSGLVTVIFISSISLSKMGKEDVQKLFATKKQMGLLPVLLVFVGIALVILAVSHGFTLPSVAQEAADTFRTVFWDTRQLDILGQIAAVLVGGIAVSVLLRKDESEK